MDEYSCISHDPVNVYVPGISSMKLKKISQGVSVDAVDDEEDVASNNKVQPHKVRKKKSIVISF